LVWVESVGLDCTDGLWIWMCRTATGPTAHIAKQTFGIRVCSLHFGDSVSGLSATCCMLMLSSSQDAAPAMAIGNAECP
jgi:hypothetical protein